MLKFKSYNLIREIKELDYSSYNTPLNEDEAIHLLKTECSEWDPKRVQLSRTIFTKLELDPIILVDGSKHELRFPKGRYHNYILLHVIDKSKTWGDIPNKYRSIDFWYSRNSAHTGVLSEMNHYILLPFNNAKLASAPRMIGRGMPFVEKVFNMPTTSICRMIERTYEKIFSKEFDFDSPDTTIGCLRELNKPIMDSAGDVKFLQPFGMMTQYLNENEVLSFLKNKMIQYEREDLPKFLDYCFGPKKNGITLMEKEKCYHQQGAVNDSGFKPGWTDSKVILIKSDFFDKIKDKL